MWKRLQLSEWTEVITIVAFVLTAAAFVYFVVRAVRMRKEKADRLASLPLDDEQVTPAREDDPRP